MTNAPSTYPPSAIQHKNHRVPTVNRHHYKVTEPSNQSRVVCLTWTFFDTRAATVVFIRFNIQYPVSLSSTDQIVGGCCPVPLYTDEAALRVFISRYQTRWNSDRQQFKSRVNLGLRVRVLYWSPIDRLIYSRHLPGISIAIIHF